MAALGYMQIPLKLVGLRFSLPFIRLSLFFSFKGFFVLFFFPEMKRQDRPAKGACYRTLGSLVALLNASFCFNGVSLGDVD